MRWHDIAREPFPAAPFVLLATVLKTPKVTNAKPLDASNALALRDAVSLTGASMVAPDPRQLIFSPALPLESCSPPALITVPLRNSTKEGRTTLRMQTLAGTTRDGDKLKVICRPAEE